MDHGRPLESQTNAAEQLWAIATPEWPPSKFMMPCLSQWRLVTLRREPSFLEDSQVSLSHQVNADRRSTAYRSRFNCNNADIN